MTSRKHSISRRQLLCMSTGAAFVAKPLLAGEALLRTPSQILGPYYPVAKPLDQDADLTVVRGANGKAAGQAIHVIGRVTNTRGEPVPGARIEIWQANTHGRYSHPGDSGTAPLDPSFQGFATVITDAEGRYRFKTIKPGAYPQDGEMRAPHIHFDVTGKSNRLITQMYFPGEPLNDRDRVLQTARNNAAGLVATSLPPTGDIEPGSLLAQWDIVLGLG